MRIRSTFFKSMGCVALCAMMFAATTAAAQEKFRISTFEAWLPKFVKDINGATPGIPQGQSWQQWCESRIKAGDLGENTRQSWIAYSDRNNNPTFEDASYNKRTGKTLSFGQRLYIAKIKDGFALVFTDVNKNDFAHGPRATAEFKGWVPIDNLLLWESCPESRNRIYEKALVVYDPTQDVIGDGKPRKNPPYILNPTTITDTSYMTATDLDILFVMKKAIVGGRTFYLLSKQMNISKDVRSCLLGWLPSEYVTEWDQRLVLEPSYEADALYDYKEKYHLAPAAFMQLAEAERYYNGTDPKIMDRAVYRYDNFVRQRMEARIMRHPILASSTNDHIFQVAVMTSKGEDVGTGYAAKRADFQNQIDELTKKQQNINVVFVIDATSSMKDFFPAVANALKNVMEHEFFSNPETRSYIRVGVVLYRDYPDHDKNGIEYKPLTHDLGSIASYLNSVTVGSIDRDDWEAMYDGLETALDAKKMGYNSEQSNFMILIGDAGNHPEWKGVSMDGKTDELAAKMFANNFNFMSYQINNKGKDEYDEFQVQIGRIQKRLVLKYQDKSKAQMKYRPVASGFFKLVRENDVDDLPIYIMKKDAQSGHSESAQELTVQVVSSIEDFYTRITNRIVQLQQMSDGGFRFSNKADEGRIREELRMAGWNEGRINSTIQFIKDGGVAKLITYAPDKMVKSAFSVYDYVLFFTEGELTNIIRQLERVEKQKSNGAKVYQEAIVSMGKAMLGDFSVTQINKMDIDEMMSLIYGVPVKIKTSGGKIGDIIYKSEEELQSLIYEFSKKLTKLKYVKTHGKEDGSMFTKNGQNYYWIRIADVPGFDI